MTEDLHVERDAPVERLDLGDGAWVEVARGWMRDSHTVYQQWRFARRTGRPFQGGRIEHPCATPASPLPAGYSVVIARCERPG